MIHIRVHISVSLAHVHLSSTAGRSRCAARTTMSAPTNRRSAFYISHCDTTIRNSASYQGDSPEQCLIFTSGILVPSHHAGACSRLERSSSMRSAGPPLRTHARARNPHHDESCSSITHSGRYTRAIININIGQNVTTACRPSASRATISADRATDRYPNMRRHFARHFQIAQ